MRLSRKKAKRTARLPNYIIDHKHFLETITSKYVYVDFAIISSLSRRYIEKFILYNFSVKLTRARLPTLRDILIHVSQCIRGQGIRFDRHSTIQHVIVREQTYSKLNLSKNIIIKITKRIGHRRDNCATPVLIPYTITCSFLKVK